MFWLARRLEPPCRWPGEIISSRGHPPPKSHKLTPLMQAFIEFLKQPE